MDSTNSQVGTSPIAKWTDLKNCLEREFEAIGKGPHGQDGQGVFCVQNTRQRFLIFSLAHV